MHARIGHHGGKTVDLTAVGSWVDIHAEIVRVVADDQAGIHTVPPPPLFRSLYGTVVLLSLVSVWSKCALAIRLFPDMLMMQQARCSMT